MQVIVAGGGIGGLALALSLHQAGLAVRVYEAVRDPMPLGGGINLQPTAVRELTELGLGQELAQIGIATSELKLFNKLGQLIYGEKRGLGAGYHWPQYSVHRGHLQMIMLRAVRDRIGSENVRSGLRLKTFEQGPDRVAARFSSGNPGTDTVDQADVLVGADGLHSAVRRQLYRDEGEPRYAQQTLWRAAVDAEPFFDGRTMVIAGHFHQRIVVYPIGGGSTRRRLLTNWVCQMTVSQAAPPREDWNRKVPKDEVLAAFGSWRFPWLDMAALIEAASEIYEFPLVDRDPVAHWSCGRVTLIGDAAHPMQPIGSQAGSQAIVDARTLTASLLGHTNPVEALRRYDEQRRPVMNEITLRNRSLGPEIALQLAEERAPDGFSRIEDVVSSEELGSIAHSFSAAAGLDAELVNSRPPFVPRLAAMRDPIDRK